jgi:hypothetical protein
VPDVEQAANLIERVALATVVQQGEVRLVRRLMERPGLRLYPGALWPV